MSDIRELERMIAEMEQMINNIPSDESQLDAALAKVDNFSSTLGYTYQNPETIKYETLVKKIETMNPIDIYSDKDTIDAISGIDPSIDIKKDIKDEINKDFKKDLDAIDTAINGLTYTGASLGAWKSTQTQTHLQNITQIDNVADHLNSFVQVTLKNIGIFSQVISDFNAKQFGNIGLRTFKKSNEGARSGDLYLYDDSTANPAFNIFFKYVLNTKDFLDAHNYYAANSKKYRGADPTGVALDLRNQAAFDKIKAYLKAAYNFLVDNIDKTIDAYILTMKGGDPDAIKKKALLLAKKKLLENKSKELRDALKAQIQPNGTSSDSVKKIEFTKINPATKANLSTAPNAIDQAASNALIALISYKLGSLNEYDGQLLTICQHYGLNTNVAIAVYLAQNRESLEHILRVHRLDYSFMMKVMVLKKKSAQQKFMKNYGIVSEQQIAMLMEKRNNW